VPHRYKKGDIVEIKARLRDRFTDEGLATCCESNKKNHVMLYEKIELENFPSFSDFKGKKYEVKHGDKAMIIKYIGRPLKINFDTKWSRYDIYEIMTTSGKKVQIFKHNLTVVIKD